MSKLFIILFSFFFALGYPQTGPDPPIGYTPRKGYPYFLRDAKGRIITTESGGILAIIADTASEHLILAPDTIQSYEIIKAASDTFSSLKREIRSYWTLEESSGNAIDSIGTADLPVSGGVTYEETGKIDDCYSFTTNGSLGNIDTYYEFTQSFSFSLWFRSDESSYSGGWATIMGNQNSGNYGYELLVLDNGTLYWRLRYNGGNILVQSSAGFNDNVFHHALVSYNHIDDTMKIWIDGDLEDSDINTNGTWYASDSRMCIGSKLGTTAYFEGYIDEPSFWNRELDHAEVDSLAAEDQYPFTEGSGGDSLRMRNIGFDERADCVIVNYTLDTFPGTILAGTRLFAFLISDSLAYKDTTFLWTGEKDTIAWTAAWTKLITGETTEIPNKDTVLIDSSDIAPPPQDIGDWDSIYANNFEQHSAPWYYNRSAFLDEWRPIMRFASRDEYRASDYRSPQWYQDNMKDSIVIDPTTGSKVLQMLFASGIHDGYDGQSGRGGDYWQHRIDGSPYTEIYVSSNMMLRPGFDWSAGGKFFWGIGGGSNIGSGGTKPEYGDGFLGLIQWGWTGDVFGCPAFYMFHQDQPHTYGQMWPFGEFQPEGENLTGQYNSSGNWEWPTADSTWINITIRCVTNTHTGTTNNKDGIFEAFINGHLVGQWGGMNLITYPDIGNEIWMLNWYQSFGGGGPPLRNEWMWNDDFWIFTFDVSVDVPRGNELSPPGRVLSLPNWPKK